MIRNLLIAIFVVSLVGATGEAFAQGGFTGAQLAQLRHGLDRTDELIAQAREAVRVSNSAVAAQALQRAETFQSQAREAYQAQAYGLSLSLTRKAREQAGVAISNSRLSEQLEGVVHGRLEKARDMLLRARETLPTPLGPTASHLLDQGRNYLAQAMEFYHQRRYRAAIKLVEQVEQIAQRLAGIARLSHQVAETFQQRLDNVERLTEYAQELSADCGSEIGREHLQRALDGLQRAHQFHADRQPRAALLALEHARKAARRAARECQDGDQLQQRYQRLNTEQERLAGELTDYSGEHRESARKLLAQAREQLESARQHMAGDRIEAAQLSLQAAQLAMRQIQRYLGERR